MRVDDGNADRVIDCGKKMEMKEKQEDAGRKWK
jgi:hypothetical protein